MEKEIMGKIIDEGEENEKEEKEWLKENKGVIKKWIEGVKKVEGKEGMNEVRQKIGI